MIFFVVLCFYNRYFQRSDRKVFKMTNLHNRDIRKRWHNHCVKRVQIRSYFWSVFSCIRTRNNYVFEHFSCSVHNIVKRLWWSETNKRNIQRCFIKKDVLKNLSKFCIMPANLLKMRLRHRGFSVNFVQFLRTAFLQKISGWLLRKDRYCIHLFMKYTAHYHYQTF